MSLIPAGKILLKAGKFQGGPLPIVNYVGQIKPADIAKITWYGPGGDDTTGDGTFATPYLTFTRALDDWTPAKFYTLSTTLDGRYEQTSRIFWDPTRPDDSGDGLTPATAKKTYAAARAAAVSGSKIAIEAIGSFTMTDLLDYRTQGQIGQTLVYDRAPDYQFQTTQFQATLDGDYALDAAYGNGIFLQMLNNLSAGTSLLLRRSVDGYTWTNVTAPWGATRTPRAICYGTPGGSPMFAVVSSTGSNNGSLMTSPDGIAWTTRLTTGTAELLDIVWSGSRFCATAEKIGGGAERRTYTSTDGIIWTMTVVPTVAASGFLCITHDSVNGLFVAAGVAKQVATSPDGLTWTDRTSLISGASATIEKIAFGNGITLLTMGNGSVHFSTSPATAWTLNAAVFPASCQNLIYSPDFQGFLGTSYNVTPQLIVWKSAGVFSSIPHPYSGIFTNFLRGLVTGNSSLIGQNVVVISGEGFFAPDLGRLTVTMMPRQYNILSDATNLKVINTRTGGFSAGIKAKNMTAEKTTGISAVSGSNTEITDCRLIATDNIGLEQVGQKLKLRNCIIKAPTTALTVNGTAAVQDDISVIQNVIVGDFLLSNPGGTQKELIQEDIIEGDFTASAPTIIKSNVRGALVNTLASSKVSTVNPVFIDEIDYFLSRVATGQAFDSPLVALSAVYTYAYLGNDYKEDFGPHRSFAALLQTTWRRAFLIPKFSGNALSEDFENVAKLLTSINGIPDVSNLVNSRIELVSWTSKLINASVRECVSYLEKQKDTSVALYYDFDESVYDSIIVDGAHGSGTFEVNIEPKDIPVGSAIGINGAIRYIAQRYPRSGQATKLVLDDVLTSGLADGQAITVEQVQGAGEYVFVPQRQRKNQRIFSRSRDSYSGMIWQFVRKAL